MWLLLGGCNCRSLCSARWSSTSNWCSSHGDVLSPQHSSAPSLWAGSTPWLQHPQLPSHTMFAGTGSYPLMPINCPLMLLTRLSTSNLPQEFELPNIEGWPWSHPSTMGHEQHLCFSWKIPLCWDVLTESQNGLYWKEHWILSASNPMTEKFLHPQVLWS